MKHTKPMNSIKYTRRSGSQKVGVLGSPLIKALIPLIVTFPNSISLKQLLKPVLLSLISIELVAHLTSTDDIFKKLHLHKTWLNNSQVWHSSLEQLQVRIPSCRTYILRPFILSRLNPNKNPGIGRATALAFAAAGCKKIALIDINREGLLETQEAIDRASDAVAVVLPTDMLDENQISTMVEKTVGYFGRVDYCVNAAGTVFSPSFYSL